MSNQRNYEFSNHRSKHSKALGTNDRVLSKQVVKYERLPDIKIEGEINPFCACNHSKVHEKRHNFSVLVSRAFQLSELSIYIRLNYQKKTYWSMT